MRLLHVINSTRPSGGGPIESIRQAAPVLAQMGHRMEIACLDPPDSPWLKELTVRARAFGPARTSYRYCPAFVSWLKGHAKDYDAVIVHGLWLHTSGGTRSALRGSGTPYFIYTHGLLDPAFKRRFPWKHLKKLLMWVLVEYRVVRDARAIFFTCEQERDLACRAFWPYRCVPAIVPYCVGEPPNGPEDQGDRFFVRYPALRGKRIVLFLSRIHPKKGCDLLIEAFASVAREDESLRLVIAGPGDPPAWEERLRRLADDKGVADKITWTGMLQGGIKWAAFRAAEVFALPTYQENYGIAIVEALGCGVPVLISNRVNIWDKIAEDRAGYIADPGQRGADELLRRWMSTPAEERQAMRQRARACFESRFDSRRAGLHLVETLRSFGVNTGPCAVPVQT